VFLLLAPNTLAGKAFASELQFRRQSFEVCDLGTTELWDVNVLYEQVRRLKPKFVINAALVSQPANGNLTREDKENALRANVLLPQTLARVCHMRNIPWGHVSSGTIFRGAKVLQDSQWLVEIDLHSEQVRHLIQSEPDRVLGFSEMDEPNHCFLCPPCDFHSGTVALGERAIRGVGNSYIWRPGVLIMDQSHPQNLLSNGVAGQERGHSCPPASPPGFTASPSAKGKRQRGRKHQPVLHNFSDEANTEAPKYQNTKTPSDPLFSVTHLGEFVTACLDLWEAHAAFGTYHIANPGLVCAKDLFPADRSFCHDKAQCFSEAPTLPGFLLETSKLNALGAEMRPAEKALREPWGSLNGRRQPANQSP
jgi:dTDP-4-dehydrorhamnose reductase